jgi:hypothetical protein
MPYEQHGREAVLKRCGVTGMRIAGNTLAERLPREVVYYRIHLQIVDHRNAGQV